jgi:NADPH:quinone reductase and related Zn-dependent oxidoreductases
MGIKAEHDANTGKSILVINGAGGVGSSLTQLAKWAGLNVYATASEKNFGWLTDHDVDINIDYHKDIKEQLNQHGIKGVDYVAVLYDITNYFDRIKDLVNPLGHVGALVSVDHPLEVGVFKSRSISFDWEFMFTKTQYNVQIQTQGEYLAKMAKLIEEGHLKANVNKIYTGMNSKTLKLATKELESGHTVGKIVIKN